MLEDIHITSGARVPIFTQDLLKPQARVFTKKKRDYGPLSVLLAIMTVIVLLPVYSSYVGFVLRAPLVMALAGVALAVVAPWTLSWRLRSRGPRLFALINVLMGLLLFTVLGETTDEALAVHGQRPFDSLAELTGAEEAETHVVGSAGRGFVELLRAMTLGGSGSMEEERPAEPQETKSEEPAGEPHVEADATGRERMDEAVRSDEPAEESVAEDTSHDAPPAIQATVEAASIRDGSPGAGSGRVQERESDGTYNVLSGVRPASTIEVPIEADGRVFTVGVIIDDRVPADFVFDTGADYTAITPVLARRLGLDPEKLQDFRSFHTAGGLVRDPVVRLGKLAIDGAEARDIEVVVCRRCSTNLLGRNFHGHFRVEIDGTAGVLRMHHR